MSEAILDDEYVEEQFEEYEEDIGQIEEDLNSQTEENRKSTNEKKAIEIREKNSNLENIVITTPSSHFVEEMIRSIEIDQSSDPKNYNNLIRIIDEGMGNKPNNKNDEQEDEPNPFGDYSISKNIQKIMRQDSDSKARGNSKQSPKASGSPNNESQQPLWRKQIRKNLDDYLIIAEAKRRKTRLSARSFEEFQSSLGECVKHPRCDLVYICTARKCGEKTRFLCAKCVTDSHGAACGGYKYILLEEIYRKRKMTPDFTAWIESKEFREKINMSCTLFDESQFCKFLKKALERMNQEMNEINNKFSQMIDEIKTSLATSILKMATKEKKKFQRNFSIDKLLLIIEQGGNFSAELDKFFDVDLEKAKKFFSKDMKSDTLLDREYFTEPIAQEIDRMRKQIKAQFKDLKPKKKRQKNNIAFNPSSQTSKENLNANSNKRLNLQNASSKLLIETTVQTQEEQKDLSKIDEISNKEPLKENDALSLSRRQTIKKESENPPEKKAIAQIPNTVLAISRFKSINNGWKYDKGAYDAITFSFENSVDFYGIGLYNLTEPNLDENPEIPCLILITQGLHAVSDLVLFSQVIDLKSPELQDKKDKILTLHFNSPIRMVGGVDYTCTVYIKKKINTWYGEKGTFLGRDEKNNEVVFKNTIFNKCKSNGTGTKLGQIPEIYYVNL